MTSLASNKNANVSSLEKVTPVYYWQHRLAGASGRIELPVNLKIAAYGNHKPRVFHFTISKTKARALNQLADQYDASLSIILLAAFKTLLYRYTNQADLLVGYPSSDYSNQHGRLTETLGNIIPVRNDLSNNPSFAELVHRIRQGVDSDNYHKNVAPEVFKNALGSKEGVEKGPLFPVIFAYRNTGQSGMDNHLFSQSYQGDSDQIAGADLIFSLENTTKGLEGALEYNSELLESETIEQMADHFQVLLEGAVLNPEESIEQIPIIIKSERNKIITEWNNTYSPYPDNKCIHQLFEEQVSQWPDAIAASLYCVNDTPSSKKKEQLTYFELNKRANQLAHYLIDLGVGPEVTVGIYMKRSLEMVISLLGILKAGGAYLPLDPGHPKDRLKFVLEDSKISILLSQTQLSGNLPAHDIRVICVDTEWEKIRFSDDHNPGTRVRPDNLAYIIYTSGSTGLPKGTLIIHRGVVNYLSWCIKTYRVTEGNGCPVNSSLAFDATVTSFLAPLLAGKEILLLPEEGEIEALSNVLQSGNRYSLIKITPAHLEILSNLVPFDRVSLQVNALVIGGEALTGKSLKHWRASSRSTRLINEYGPTETVVGCCIYEIPEHAQLYENVPIGRPIANTQIYILDKYLHPVPIGVAGEIYIGGAGLARGYLNRPELTAERFISNPFSTDPDERLYKTGDLARYLHDGNIVFLGRSDYQVKIRGYRIELGEIESCLSQQAAIQQCSVIVREDFPGDRRLVAYIVFKPGNSMSTKDLKRFLSDKLPEYMVPSAMVVLHTLPLTTNGKVNRAALPIPDQNRTDPESFAEARDNVETELTKIVGKVLQNNHIGIKDNFFELGLHSMQAYALFAQVKKSFGIQLPLSILFQAPTIEQLATYLKGQEANLPWSSIVAIQPNGTRPPLFLIHAGAGTVLFYRELASHLGTDQPVYGLQPQGLDGKQKFHKTIEEMATHYVKEIRRIDPEGPYFLGGYCFGAVVAFEMAQQLIAEGCRVAMIANFNGVSPTYVHSSYNEVDEETRAPATANDNQKTDDRLGTAAVVYPRFSWKSLAQKSSREKFHFLAGKFRNRIINPLHRRLSLLKYYYVITVMWVFKYYRALGFKTWEPLRKYFFLGYNSEMVRTYKPKPYHGRMTIFRSPGIYSDPHLGWTEFVKEEIKTLDIPGYHKDRRQIMNEPFVQSTAGALKKELEEFKVGTR